MASNGLSSKAKRGKCHICLRKRCTDRHVKPVGEVRHGFATGHIWECRDIDDCETSAIRKMNNINTSIVDKNRIKQSLKTGRIKEYIITV